MNTKAIADALAGRYSGLTATNGAVTESLSSTPTASLPNQVTRGPVILVNPPEYVQEIGVSAIRRGIVRFVVVMLRDPLNVPDRTDWLYAWDNAMRDRVEANLDLDLPTYVAEAEVTIGRLALDGAEYAGVVFDSVEHEVEVSIYEQSVSIGV